MNYFETNTGSSIAIVSDISIKLCSPLPIFDRNNSYTLPFTIRATNEIDIIFGRARLINSSDNKQRTIYGNLHIGKMLKLYGILRVLKISGENYIVNFTGQGAAYKQLSENNMNEDDYGTGSYENIAAPERTTYDDYLFKIDGENAYAFPVHYNYKFEDNFPLYEGAFALINYNINDASNRRLVPSFFVQWLIEEGLKRNGFTIEKNVLNNSIYDGLMVFSNYWDVVFEFSEREGSPILDITEIKVEDEKVTLVVTGPISNLYQENSFIKLYDLTSDNLNYEGRVVQIEEKTNDTEEEVYEIVFTIEDSTLYAATTGAGKVTLMDYERILEDSFQVNNHLPNTTFLEFLKIVEAVTGTITIIDETTGTCRIVWLKEIINNLKYTDISSFAGKVDGSELNTLNGYHLYFNGAKDDFYNESVKESDTKYTEKDPVAELGDLPISGSENNDIRLVTSLNRLYIYDKSDYGSRQVAPSTDIYLGSWRFFSENYRGISEDDGDFEIAINAAPLPTYAVKNYYNERQIARIDIPTNASFVEDTTEYGVRFLFFSSLDGGYPLGKDENEDMKLSIRDDKGIYELFYKEWIDWRLNRARPATSIINWPKRLLNSFKWDEKFRIQNTNYLVEEIYFTAKKNGVVKFGDTKLVRC